MKQISRYLKTSLILFIFSLLSLLFVACAEKTQTYTVKYLAEAGGSIYGDAEQQILSGGNATAVTAIPDEGYQFVEWSDGFRYAQRTDRNVSQDITVTAKFKEITYTIEYKTDGNGRIEGTSKQKIQPGGNGTMVLAIPNVGYQFVEWSDGEKNATRTEENVNQDITVTAKFEEITYAIAYTTDGNGTINGEVSQTIKVGGNATVVTAIPNRGYKFIKWSDGNTNSTRNDLNIMSDNVYIAEFEFLFAGGDGTVINPYQIENYTQLTNISYYPYEHYILIDNLDLIGIEHEPIFDAENSFGGIFDGANNTISNLTVKSKNNFPSLFGFCNQTSEVKNLNFTNANIITTDFNTVLAKQQYCVGVVAGVFQGKLKNVNVGGTINANGLSFDSVAIGGLAGWASVSTIVNCHADVNILISNVRRDNSTGVTVPFSFGGLLGVGTSVILTECSVSGDIQMHQSVYELRCGGLIGYYFTSQNSILTISKCSADVTITSDNYYTVGGFIGLLDVNGSDLTIEHCSARGIKNAGYVGGFINTCDSYGELLIRNCRVENDIIGSITGARYLAGFICDMYGSPKSKSSIENCYYLGNIKSNDEKEGDCAGFFYSAYDCDFVLCYVTGTIFAKEAVGFGRSVSGCNLIGCFFSGEIRATRRGDGFCASLYGSNIMNCYSTGNVYFVDVGNTNSTYGFVGILGRNSKIENSYYGGRIDNRPIIGLVSGESQIINFHTLCLPNGEQKIIGNNRNETEARVEVNAYQSPEEMYFLADKLNADSEEAFWINVENDYPKLKFM